MATYYLDTSALVKRYVAEHGSAHVLRLTGRAAGHELYTARVTGPELVATLIRRMRAGDVSPADALQMRSSFLRDWRDQFKILEISAASQVVPWSWRSSTASAAWMRHTWPRLSSSQRSEARDTLSP